ncbi:MAG: hypothetical protein H0U67_02240 [Gemmatimonadetes bacterium]|nr:hypothetical protein [Gemmatimonadota bacterium]
MNEPMLPMRGIFRDVLRDLDGRILYDSGWRSNTIVTRCRILLSAFLANDSASGIQYLAVGRGGDAWDGTGAPPSPPESTTDLVNRSGDDPIARDDLDIVYLDGNDEVQAEPSPRLQITATLAPGYPRALPGLSTYPLCEFGLFGRLGGTDYMINSIRHPVIHKDESATLIRVVRLYF